MRFFLVLLLLAGCSNDADIKAQQAIHAAGRCAQMPAGTGLKNGRGWVRSMIPGTHRFYAIGGTVSATSAHLQAVEMVPTKFYFLTVSPPDARVEWEPPGLPRAPVPTTFLYP